MKLFIKNMKGPGCVEWLAAVLLEFNIPQPQKGELGEVILPLDTPPTLIASFKERLANHGFFIIFDRKSEARFVQNVEWRYVTDRKLFEVH